MNKKNTFCFLLFLQSFLGFSQFSASVSVDTRVTIIEPIKIAKAVDLDFGNVVAAYNPGKVTLSPEGDRLADGVEISSSFPGNVSPAEAVVKHGNNSYSIVLPESYTLFNQEDPNQALIIDQFTVSPQTGKFTDILKIGATLHLEANQKSGFYTNTTGFNVTVSYN